MERQQQERALAVSTSTRIHDYTREHDDKMERQRRAAAAAANWRALEQSLSDLGRAHEMTDITRTGVDATASSSGLRKRTAGPMDAVSALFNSILSVIRLNSNSQLNPFSSHRCRLRLL